MGDKHDIKLIENLNHSLTNLIIAKTMNDKPTTSRDNIISKNEKEHLNSPIELNCKYKISESYVYCTINEILELKPEELEISKKIRVMGLYMEKDGQPFLFNNELDTSCQLKFVNPSKIPRSSSYISVTGFLNFFELKPVVSIYFWKYITEPLYKNLDNILHNLKIQLQYNNRLLLKHKEKDDESFESKIDSLTTVPDQNHKKVCKNINIQKASVKIDPINENVETNNINNIDTNFLNSSCDPFDETMVIDDIEDEFNSSFKNTTNSKVGEIEEIISSSDSSIENLDKSVTKNSFGNVENVNDLDDVIVISSDSSIENPNDVSMDLFDDDDL